MTPTTFTSADGSTRCTACHLHPDACTCGHMPRILWACGLLSPEWDDDLADGGVK